jgi:nicotinate-nucleotide adenylyltransferase
MSAADRAPEVDGILGGTFDPVHDGHLRIADEVRRLLGLSRTFLLPTAVPPHKTPGRLSPVHHREAMLRLAVGDREGLEISTLELGQEVCYTIDTLRQLRDGRPPRSPVFILGMDALLQITSWRQWRELIREFDLAAIDRVEGQGGNGDDPHPEVAARIVLPSDRTSPPDAGRGGRIFRMDVLPIPVSSSEIRARASAGRDLTGLVPPAVARYIHEMGLYRQEKDR